MRLQKILSCAICATVCATSCAKMCYATEVDKSTEQEKSGLSEIFGVKFGKVMSANEHCITNDAGELVYEYTPEKRLRDFSDYRIFATPITRRVLAVRTVCRVGSDDADDAFESAVRVLEKKFKKNAFEYVHGSKAILFENMDCILVEQNKEDKTVCIDASSKKFRDLREEEVTQAEKKIYAPDIEALNLLPGKDKKDGRIYEIDAILGQKFGDPFVGGGSGERNSSDDLFYEYHPKEKFMNCREYRVFCTAQTKKAFMIRAAYKGVDADWQKERIHRVIEMATGRTMEKTGKGNYILSFGDVVISVVKYDDDNILVVDVARKKLFRQNEEERKMRKESEDMDAL